MSIFEFNDYRKYIRHYIESLPKGGRGELSRIANHLQVNTTLLSQIMSGLREFSQEQAFQLSQFWGHSEIECDYFSLLVQKQKAGSKSLKDYLEKKLSHIRDESSKLSKRIFSGSNLSDKDRAIFYSSWIYSAIHLYSSTIDKGVTLDEIAIRFELSRAKAQGYVQFLLECGLYKEESGRYKMGVQSTFVEQGSPFLLKHHSNWRIKAIQKSEKLSEKELMYTGQVSISKKDFVSLKEKITELLKDTMNIVKDSPAEEIACLNIDWFWIDK